MIDSVVFGVLNGAQKDRSETRMNSKLIALMACAFAILGSCQKSNNDIEWVDVAGGCFEMGRTGNLPEENPAHDVCVDGFSIMPTEVTNAQFEAFVNSTGHVTRAERGWKASEKGGPSINLPPSSAVFQKPTITNPRSMNWWRLVEGANWRYPFGPEGPEAVAEEPVVHITREDAVAFADWAGGRLPTEEEWEFAARGGDTRAPHVLPVAQTDEANTWQGLFPITNDATDGYERLAPVKSFPPNALGLYDMLGNVWELTSSPYTPSHSQRDKAIVGPSGLDPSQPGVAVSTIKGGSYLCAPNFCQRYRTEARQAQDVAFGTSHIGFRLVRD